MRMRLSSSSSISRGTICLFCFLWEINSRGCFALYHLIICLSSMLGFIASRSMANVALALMKSIVARNSYDCNMSATSGRRMSVNVTSIFIISLRSSLSNSLMRLLASTTSAGSINTVLPEADSSCTIPFIFRLNAGATGITRRPSRMVGVTSFSTSPSFWAVRKIALRLRDIPLETCAISFRMRLSSADALSFMRPNLSRILSILLISWGNIATSPANAYKYG